MNLADVDWSVLRRPLTVLIISLALSAAVVTVAYFYSSSVQREYTKESRRLSSARGRYLTLDDEKRLIQEFYPLFQRLSAEGRIGGEQRLNWVESLRSVADGIKLPSLQYEIGAQSKFKPDYPIKEGQVDVLSSDMRLRIGLFHEEDLPRLFSELAVRATGVFNVSSCRITRPQSEFQEDPTKPNLEAECQLRWLTVNPAEKKDVAPTRRRRRRA